MTNCEKSIYIWDIRTGIPLKGLFLICRCNMSRFGFFLGKIFAVHGQRREPFGISHSSSFCWEKNSFISCLIHKTESQQINRGVQSTSTKVYTVFIWYTPVKGNVTKIGIWPSRHLCVSPRYCKCSSRLKNGLGLLRSSSSAQDILTCH